jgi:hypothetical protein
MKYNPWWIVPQEDSQTLSTVSDSCVVVKYVCAHLISNAHKHHHSMQTYLPPHTHDLLTYRSCSAWKELHMEASYVYRTGPFLKKQKILNEN